jgi:hypothetical protein
MDPKTRHPPSQFGIIKTPQRLVAMTPRVELWLRFNSRYRQALLIPFHEFQRFSSHPLAWLSHIAYTIYGNIGHISLSSGGQEVDCHAENILPSITMCHKASLIFHFMRSFLLPSISDPRLLDPDLMEDRASFSTVNTTRRGDFQQRVLARDKACILTGGDAENVQACHVVPYSKGDEVCFQYHLNHSKFLCSPST